MLWKKYLQGKYVCTFQDDASIVCVGNLDYIASSAMNLRFNYQLIYWHALVEYFVKLVLE